MVSPREVPRIQPGNTHNTTDQHITLFEGASFATHHGGCTACTGDTDGCARNAKHSEYKEQLLQTLLRIEGELVGPSGVGAVRRIGRGGGSRPSRGFVPKVRRRVMVPEKHRGESLLWEVEDKRGRTKSTGRWLGKLRGYGLCWSRLYCPPCGARHFLSTRLHLTLASACYPNVFNHPGLPLRQPHLILPQPNAQW